MKHNELLNTPEWQALQLHFRQVHQLHMRDLFANDDNRFAQFSVEAGNLLLDFSKNRITDETLALLLNLAERSQLGDKISALFSGQPVNTTENRAALHTALRRHQALDGDANTFAAQIDANLQAMRACCEKIHQHQWVGVTGMPITDIVNVGIGGSYLGPRLAIEALAPYPHYLNCHFIANVDAAELTQTLAKVNPATTLFIIASKSFSTQETLANFREIQHWLKQQLGDSQTIMSHFIAITANIDKALALGFSRAQIFPLWDWVGGRFSMWSAMGLSIALTYGMDVFESLLNGAARMDLHFKQTAFHQNMPVILGLIGIWYINFFNAQSQAIIPYHHLLRSLPAYLQQLDMESNGKTINMDGQSVEYATGPVIFGETGTLGQHAFHQLLHQGAPLIPIDFILPLQSHYQPLTHQQMLIANCLAQGAALVEGTMDETLENYRKLPGNKPSNLLTFTKLTPETLGQLIALYEHKIYVQSVIWQINAFDQWGVELGKVGTNKILEILATEGDTCPLTVEDERSTTQLLKTIWHRLQQ